MNVVRRFTERDIPQVAALHRRVFQPAAAVADTWLDAYRRYFAEVFLCQALNADVPASLVYERDGCVRGFIGVALRRMRFDGKPRVMAVCSQFVVDPAERGQIGLRLLKQCLAGPQDFTITDEAGESTRRMWEWCGGERVLPYSMQWIRPLRPAQFGLSLLAGRKLPKAMGGATMIGRMVDPVIATLAPHAFRVSKPLGTREELDEQMFLSCVREATGDRSLCPDYDDRSASWTFARARCTASGGRMRKFVVRAADGDPHVVGWWLYCLRPDGVADVLQIGSRRGAAGEILDHVFRDAMENGAVAVSGRMDPDLMPALAERRALFCRGPYWTLLHSPHADLRHAVHRGDAFLTRLEGEWGLRFQY